MAIAPIGQRRDRRDEATRPPLRLLPGGRPSSPSGPPRHARPAGAPRHADPRPELPQLPRPVRTEERVRHAAARVARQREALRRQARLRSRRRRAVLLGSAVAATALLALPLHSLAAVTLDGRVTPGGAPAGLAPGSLYVVPAGMTLHQVAVAFAGPAGSAHMAQEIVAETGSTQLVPGEHLLVP